MLVLVIGLLLFLGAHSVRIVAEGWRAQTIGRLGEKPWKGLYTLVSLIGFALIVWGYGLARQQPVVLWQPPVFMKHLNSLFTLLAFIFLAAAYVPVAEKYGWNVGGWLGEYSAEIALVAVAAPLAIQTAKAHREHAAAIAAANAPKKPEALPKKAPEPAADGKLPAIEREPAADRGGMLTAA